MDRSAAAQTPPPSRRVTTMKFGRAASESRTMKSSHARKQMMNNHHEKTTELVEGNITGRSTSLNYSQQQTYVGYQSSSGDMMWRRQNTESSETRLSPPISICSEKSA
jgi:hypothetical protein